MPKVYTKRNREEYVQISVRLSATEWRAFRALTVLNGETDQNVIRRHIHEYVATHKHLFDEVCQTMM